VGEWRVLVELDIKGRRLLVLRVLPRGRAYER
jgi:mRNA-degrading endonuclease RelE of RelBE toxin-antitoxin system